MVSSLLTKVDIRASLPQFFLQYDETLRTNYATLKKRYAMKITQWVMSSQMNTMYHAYIYIYLYIYIYIYIFVLNAKNMFMCTPLDSIGDPYLLGTIPILGFLSKEF